MKRTIRYAGLALVIAVAGFFILLFTGTIWRSPGYLAASPADLPAPIISMRAYDTLADHQRPYLYHLKDGRGEIHVMGIDHTRDPEDPQISLIAATWNSAKPDIAFVEGRLGFLFQGIQDPVREYGENGLTVSLAKDAGVPYFTWEPRREDEVAIVLKKFMPQQAAMFYALRPYLSNFRFGKPENPDAVMQELIDSRTDYDGIRGQISSVAQLDQIWKRDFGHLGDWRDMSDELGWPEGYLFDIFSLSNDIRDRHLCALLLQEARDGKKVFVTMGSSHAFRIEGALRSGMRTVRSRA